MTVSTTSESMATGRLSFHGARSTSAPAWMGSPWWHICDGSRSRGHASNQANWWARPVPATTADRSGQGHAEAARSWLSHVGSPAPSLVVLHPGAPQRHSQILVDTRRSVACLSARQNARGRSSLDGSLGEVLWLPSFPRRPVIGGPGLAAGVLAEAP